ncbi:MAG TPA: OsmC family protein [Prolixibacteraceae bacterium]|nr:OsmC family protein [Prolixibacteraceae bacterium]HPR60869.1 OsmC family protein [Prolixibacteraceae bacterium]
MKQETLLSWKGNMEFETELNGHKLTLDASPESGGSDKGPRPKMLMLTSLAGCTGMDVVMILKKMKIEPEEFNVRVDGFLTEDYPKYYEKMHIIYEFKGDNLPLEKLKKAIELSQEKYCGVSAVYRKAIELSYEIKLL